VKIHTILNRLGNDFWAEYECEYCNHVTQSQSGYEDAHYHDNVIPAKYCPVCGLNRAGQTKEESGVNEQCVPVPEEHITGPLSEDEKGVIDTYLRFWEPEGLAETEVFNAFKAMCVEYERMKNWLETMEPSLDAVICYASTINEHPINGTVKDIRDWLKKEKSDVLA